MLYVLLKLQASSLGVCFVCGEGEGLDSGEGSGLHSETLNLTASLKQPKYPLLYWTSALQLSSSAQGDVWGSLPFSGWESLGSGGEQGLESDTLSSGALLLLPRSHTYQFPVLCL